MKRSSKSNLVVEEVSTERQIAEMQLERLKAIAMERMLNYEEVKIFDLLTKNLLLAKGDATTITATSRYEPEAIEEAVLVRIANSIDESLIGKSLEVVDKDD